MGMDRRASLPAALLIASALWLSGCATAPTTSSSAQTPSEASTPTSPGALTRELRLLQRGVLAVREHQLRHADDLLTRVTNSPELSDLSPSLTHTALLYGGFAALADGHSERALELLRRSTAMSLAGQADWVYRLNAAWLQHAATDEVISLTRLAVSWPATLRRFPYQIVMYVAGVQSGTLVDRTEQFELLSALYHAHYRLPYDAEPSALWRQLALLLIERGQTTAARQVLRHVTAPFTLIAILVDNRFASVRAGLKSELNIDHAVASEESRLLQVAREHPRELGPVYPLADLLISAHQYQAALRVLDRAIANIQSQPGGVTFYSDQGQWYSWMLNERSNAYYGLARWNDARMQQLAAAKIPENGQANVSQIINLAGLYDDLGDPRDARSTLRRLPSAKVTAYGAMQVQLVRLIAAVQLHDTLEITRALDYMRAHQQAAESTYQHALVDANRLPAARRLMLKRLANPRQRSRALMDLQRYPPSPEPATRRAQDARWRAFIAEPAVRSAAARVGIIGQFDIGPIGPSE